MDEGSSSRRFESQRGALAGLVAGVIAAATFGCVSDVPGPSQAPSVTPGIAQFDAPPPFQTNNGGHGGSGGAASAPADAAAGGRSEAFDASAMQPDAADASADVGADAVDAP